MTQQVVLEPISHTYTVADVVYPSATQVIEAMGLSDYSRIPPDELVYYQQRGTNVHLATQLDDEGDLDEESVTEDVLVRVFGYRICRKELPFRILETEKPHFEPVYGYCGTPDLFVALPNRDRAVIDKKSGPIIPAARIQTAAYANFYAPFGGSIRRFALHLKGDKTYDLREFPLSDLRRDLSVFLSALTVHKWRQEHIR